MRRRVPSLHGCSTKIALGRASLAWSQLVAADAVHTSDLTLGECDRTLRRAVATGRLSASESLRLHAIVERASAFWALHGMGAEVVERSRRSFPCEPIRSLNALHLATALLVRNLSSEVQVLSFADWMRDNATALGLDVVPEMGTRPPSPGWRAAAQRCISTTLRNRWQVVSPQPSLELSAATNWSRPQSGKSLCEAGLHEFRLPTAAGPQRGSHGRMQGHGHRIGNVHSESRNDATAHGAKYLADPHLKSTLRHIQKTQ